MDATGVGHDGGGSVLATSVAEAAPGTDRAE